MFIVLFPQASVRSMSGGELDSSLFECGGIGPISQRNSWEMIGACNKHWRRRIKVCLSARNKFTREWDVSQRTEHRFKDEHGPGGLPLTRQASLQRAHDPPQHHPHPSYVWHVSGEDASLYGDIKHKRRVSINSSNAESDFPCYFSCGLTTKVECSGQTLSASPAVFWC